MKTLSWENKDPLVMSPRCSQGCVQGVGVAPLSAWAVPALILHGCFTHPGSWDKSEVNKGRYQSCYMLSVFGVSPGGGRRDHIPQIPYCVSSAQLLLHRIPCAAEPVGLAPASLQACGRDKQWNVLNRKLCSVRSSSSPSIGILFSSPSS